MLSIFWELLWGIWVYDGLDSYAKLAPTTCLEGIQMDPRDLKVSEAPMAKILRSQA